MINVDLEASTSKLREAVRAAAPARNRVLRFGIDAEALRRPLSGVGQYCYNLCEALEKALPGVEFYAYGRLPREQLRLPSWRWTLRQEPVSSVRKVPSYVWLKTRGRELCLADRLDFFWAVRTIHPRLPTPTRTICTVHDLNHVLVPETMQMAPRLMHRLWFEGDVRYADHVFTNSAGTASRVRRHIGAPVRDVLRPGVHPRFRPLGQAERVQAESELLQFGIRRPYLLSVGTIEPRKNVDGLYRAFRRLKREGHLGEHQLVIVGKPGWGSKPLLRELQQARDIGVVLPGYIPDRLMPAVYNLADTFVFPSLYEGFGMPVLEARACGTQTVISDLPEVREPGGPDAVVVEPTVTGIAAGILRAVGQSRDGDAGTTTLAKHFSWLESAQRMAALIQEPTIS